MPWLFANTEKLKILFMFAVHYLTRRVKGVVHFKKKTFADNLLTPMSSKISMSFFLQLKINLISEFFSI